MCRSDSVGEVYTVPPSSESTCVISTVNEDVTLRMVNLMCKECIDIQLAKYLLTMKSKYRVKHELRLCIPPLTDSSCQIA